MLEQVELGKTGLRVSRIAMGCIPIQRLSRDDAVALLMRAYENGVNFFDTAHVYTDSEEKIGAAFAGGIREKIVIASKAMADTYDETMRQLDESLRRLRTDYIDLYQWHNPESIAPADHGPYQAMLDAKKAGKIRHIGVTNHSLAIAEQAIREGGFETLQYPMSVLSSEEEIAMSFACRDAGMGFIAMKAMCGGLLPDGKAPYAFLNQYPHIVPIWGMEKREELDQFLGLAKTPQPYTDEMRAEVEAIRAEYGEHFCRGCGYCMPCPAGILLPVMMRIDCFIKRNVPGSQFTEQRQKQIAKIDDCVHCGQCTSQCPYKLDVPAILQRQKENYNRRRADYMRATAKES